MGVNDSKIIYETNKQLSLEFRLNKLKNIITHD